MMYMYIRYKIYMIYNTYIIIFNHYYFIPLRIFFPTSVSRWFFTGIWETANLFNSTGLFPVTWPILIML